jgi:hypothetical protein
MTVGGSLRRGLWWRDRGKKPEAPGASAVKALYLPAPFPPRPPAWPLHLHLHLVPGLLPASCTVDMASPPEAPRSSGREPEVRPGNAPLCSSTGQAEADMKERPRPAGRSHPIEGGYWGLGRSWAGLCLQGTECSLTIPLCTKILRF